MPQGGYAWNSAKTSAGAGYTPPLSMAGVLGVYGGYNWQAGSWVFGGRWQHQLGECQRCGCRSAWLYRPC